MVFWVSHFIRFIFLIGLIGLANAQSIEAVQFSTPEQARRYQTLIAEIRCPVCQGQSIGGSNANLAQDLRQRVQTMIKQNQSDDEIREFMVARYGDFVVFKPPVKPNTYVLWFAPFGILAFGLWVLMRTFLRKKSRAKNPIDTSKAKDLLK